MSGQLHAETDALGAGAGAVAADDSADARLQ